MIKIIFFDFDGVIAESVDIKTHAFAKLFEKERIDVVKKFIDYHLDNAGVSRYEKFKYMYKEILRKELSDETFAQLCNNFAKLVVDSVVNAPYVKGAKEFLEKYSKKYKCFVVSATPQNEIRDIVKQKGIQSFFDTVYGAPHKKTDMVKKVIDESSINPADALYIGDAISDYDAAKDNGVGFIARTRHGEMPFANIKCLKVEDLADLESVIAKL